MDTGYYPLLVSLQERVCLVVGGGGVAERKVRSLLRHGASVRVVARELTDWLETQRALHTINHLAAEYHTDHLNGTDLVFAATDDFALNRQVAMDAGRLRLWCNMATEPQLGTCVVPAVVERGRLTIAVSTGGVSPAVARRLRESLEQQFGPEWGPYLELVGNIRFAIQQQQLGTQENQRLFRELAKLPLPQWLRENRQELALNALHEICGPWLNYGKIATFWKEACAHYSS